MVNELDVPILCMGLKDVVVSASPEGILVSDKEQSSYIKPYVNTLDHRVMFAEKSWGSFKVIDIDKASMTIKVTLNAGHQMNYHSHQHRDEVWTVIAGKGKTIVDGMEQNVKAGDVITSVNGTEITGSSDLVSLVSEAAIGDMLTMTVYRQGSTMELTVTVGEQVQSALANEQTQQAASDSQSGGWNGYPFGGRR